MPPVPMKHMVILLPGIMGSVLQTSANHDLWSLSGQAIGRFLLSRGDVLRQLALPAGDNIEHPLAPDGIRATRLIEDLHSVPGLVEGAGYREIHRYVTTVFQVVEGDIANPQDNANYYPFPYDWRRDIRASAYNLKRFIDRQLPIWRKKFGGKDAQVILLAHSMGGLVSRYYLDVLEGWRDTLVAITFGTPHRGSVNALDMLSNGFQISGGLVKRSILTVVDGVFNNLFGQLTTAVRSFPSVYQLMPRYPMLHANGQWMRIAEAPPSVTIPHLDRNRALRAYQDFYLAIDAAFEKNQQHSAYRFKITPVIGTRQPTVQSALLNNGAIVTSFDPPPNLDPMLANGDGTVPQVSALPLELADDALWQRFFVTEHHGWLPNNEVVREGLLDQLVGLVAKSTSALRGSSDTVRPVLSIDLDPLYLLGEIVLVRLSAAAARSNGSAAPPQLMDLSVQVSRVDGREQLVLQQQVQAGEGSNSASLELAGLPAGLYRVQARLRTPGQRPVAANGVFEIIDASVAV